jgi:hypothetical protein
MAAMGAATSAENTRKLPHQELTEKCNCGGNSTVRRLASGVMT